MNNKDKEALDTKQVCEEDSRVRQNDVPAQDDDLMSGRWVRFNDDDDTTCLLIELEVAMNGVERSAKSPAVIDVLRQAVDYFNEGKKYHVLPTGDIKPHKESESCECKPTIEIYGNNKVFIHNSFDGRESLEQPLTRDWKETIDERIARDSEFKEALEQSAQEQLSGKTGELNPVACMYVSDEQQEPYAYAYIREDGVGQLCWTKRDASLFKDLLEGWKEIPLYTKEK